MTKRRDVVKFLERNGFVNFGGSNHDTFRHKDGRRTVVPRHKEIGEPLYAGIKKQAGLK